MGMVKKKPKTARSLALIFTAIFLIFNVSVLLIDASKELYFHFKTQQKAAADSQQLLAKDAANKVANFVNENLRVIETAIKIGDPISATPKNRRRLLEKLRGFNPAFRQLALLDAQQRQLSSVSRLPQKISRNFLRQIDRDLFVQIKQKESYIGSVYIDDITSEPMVIMAFSVSNVFDDFEGALMVEVNLKFMWNLVADLKIGKTGIAYVVDKKGNLIAARDLARVLQGKNLGHLKEVKEFMGSSALIDETGANRSRGLNGVESLSTFVPLKKPDWAIVTELPVKEAYQELYGNAMIIVITVLVVALFGGLVGVFIARRLAAPLINLTETATQIANGDMGVKANIDGPFEVVRLASAFNNMTRQLKEGLLKEEKQKTKLQQTLQELERNIAVRQKTEEALQESERLLNEVGKIAKIGGWEMDLETGKAKWTQGTYDVVEIGHGQPIPGAEEHVGYYLPEYRPLVSEAMQALVEHNRALDYEAQAKTAKGNIIWVRAIGRALIEEGRCIKAYGTLQDITDRKQAEQEIRELNRTLELRVSQRTAQLQEANKELEDFVYSVSHDLRAPLRSVSGFAEIIDRRHKASLNEEGRHYFDNIVKASKQMGDLIDDLLKFSRLGRKAIEPENVSLDDVFETAIKTLSDIIKETDTKIIFPEKMPDIQGDMTLATHVFINLFENAVKYHQPGIPPRIDVGFENEDRYVTISVADNGIGIAPEYHEKIFNIFQRLHTEADYPGTGIGLAAVKKALQIMGGRVWVESTPGQGSIFKIQISIAC